MMPTKKQKILLEFIDGFIMGNGYSPSYREIMTALGYKSVSTVAKHVDNLIARGWLIKRDGEARTLEVVMPGEVSEDETQTHEQWLVEMVQQKERALTDEERRVIAHALELLGIAQEGRRV